MTNGPGSAREAAERNAQAVMSGNFNQIMADITPEALAQMMQLAPQGGAGLSLANMPNITGYELREVGTEGEGELFHVTFSSALGKATLGATWKQVLGQWKITAVTLVGTEPAAAD
ncbi:MAG: hypothetical protein HYX53_01890 [Chloroflexi bacterium]|nr:hypothetical protein [Chloroflexota bacterium]